MDYNDLEPMFDAATGQAKQSPCVRRQYGAAIGRPNVTLSAHNVRVTRACDGLCARDVEKIVSGDHVKTEIGAEIHAEAAVLIKHGIRKQGSEHFVLVGFMGDHEFLGQDAYPCLWCAKMIKYAGFKNVFMRDNSRQIMPYSIDEIIEYWETPYERY